jgi:TonB-dependent SusC/RagA subfamily outer membrane receptor
LDRYPGFYKYLLVKMKAKAILLSFVILFCPVFLEGQKANRKITVAGKVVDENQKPVVGAVIFIDKIKTEIATDEQGNYKIKVRPDSKEILVFTLFNGASEEIINDRTTINFILTGKSQDAGKKTKVPDKEPANSEKETSQKGDMKVFNIQDATYSTYQTIYDMIRGRFPGVEVSGKSIKVMGSSSLNVSTEPVFVVDGVIVSSIEDISPQTVKSIEVLKGPEATAYGTRGSNGVIVITRLTGKDIIK